MSQTRDIDVNPPRTMTGLVTFSKNIKNKQPERIDTYTFIVIKALVIVTVVNHRSGKKGKKTRKPFPDPAVVASSLCLEGKPVVLQVVGFSHTAKGKI